VLETILPHIEELADSYKSLDDRPPHVLHSLKYLVSLTSDCCSASRDHARSAESPRNDGADVPLRAVHAHLDDSLVTRFLDVFKHLLKPLPDDFVLPAHTILGDCVNPEAGPPPDISQEPVRTEPLPLRQTPMESSIGIIVEYITASNWPCSFDYLRQSLYALRPAASQSQSQSNPGQAAVVTEEEHAALVFLRLLSFYGIDGRKLGLVVQEICSNFLHLRKSFQNTLCAVASLMISRWIDRHPEEFVQLHNVRKRLDGSVDTLFDMVQSAIDNGRRKAIYYPLQTVLLFLNPDIFEVASNLRQTKSSSMSKKVAFLDTLRKSLRNRNELACCCLISVLRVARHFDFESDAAILSYAMDVQDEVRDAVFRHSSGGVDCAVFEQGVLTATFVSFTQLNLDNPVDSLVQSCLASSAPIGFQLAVIQGCCYFARQADPTIYAHVFAAAAPFVKEQFQVRQVLVFTGLVLEANPA
jgi:neurofibromin 1